MEIEFLNADNAAQWDEFATASPSAWFRHTTAWMKYSSCCRFDSNTRNFSFMVKQGHRIQAIVPLLVEYSYPQMTFDCFAMYGDYTPLPAFVENGEVSKVLVVEAIDAQLDRIAAENNVKYGKFIIDPLIEYPYFKDFAPFNLLTEGAEIRFSTTNIVSLDDDEEVIIRNMRKGHKAAIKQVMKESGYRVDLFDKDNVTKEQVLKFKEIHRIDAGRQTRTDASWDCMYEWIADGNGVLAMLWIDAIGGYGAAALVMHCKKSAYYASYATLDSTFLNSHCGHIIQWELIKYLKAHGISRYETGDNYWNLGDSDNDRKLNEIAKYKRGFRTFEIPKLTFYKSW